MPRMDGFEFLETVKADNLLKNIPVIILTTSDTNESATRSFDLGAAGYIVKSVDYRQFVESMRAVDGYWSLSRLPGGDE